MLSLWVGNLNLAGRQTYNTLGETLNLMYTTTTGNEKCVCTFFAIPVCNQ